MRCAVLHIAVVLSVLMATFSCGKVRRIPEGTFVKITQEMMLADVWLDRHPSARDAVDTTYLYDAVFEKYGYSFADYDSTLSWYMAHPEKYVKVAGQVKARVEAEVSRLDKEIVAGEEEEDTVKVKGRDKLKLKELKIEEDVEEIF